MSQLDPTSAEIFDLSDEVTLPEGEASPVIGEVPHEDPTAPASESGSADAAALPPFPLPVRPVSGRYRGSVSAFQLELRVDVDRTRPMKRVSGDFFSTNGATTSYFGSFVVNSPTVTVTASQVQVKGLGTYTFAAGAPVVQVTIPRRTVFQPQGPATVQYFTTGGSPGATYGCPFASARFRTMRIETDRVSNVGSPVFSSYNTGSLPSGGAARNLSVVSAYAEAGIEMIPTLGSNVIDVVAAGGGATWSNAELHAAMQQHFTLWKDLPQWAVWQLVAQLHDLGAGLYGIMFDQQGKQRQGCAVFHQGIGGTTPEQLRLQLYTYVHELGHAFNLLHSWQKSYANPPAPNRPNALSWMNYPWGYPGGAAQFWSTFPFQFDDQEIIHLRHAFRNNIIMGGNNFAVGAALSQEVMADKERDESGLNFSITTHKPSFALGEPVVLQLQLAAYDVRGRRVHTWLHPNCGMVKIVIRKPSGEIVAYEPLIDHLVGAREADVSIGDAVQDSAYIGYGKGGLYFDQPGRYLIRAAYAALDGSEVLSDVLTLRVRYPVTAAQEELADLFIGDEQGTLLYLLGSDNESLRGGNDAFDKVIEKHANSEMASYARLVKGINAGREFKAVDPRHDNLVTVRSPRLDESATLLAAAVGTGVIDPVSTQMALFRLADVHTREGNDKAAQDTLAKASTMALRTS